MSSYIKRRPTKLFIPARDPRHRTACLALYRALLRSTPQIPLPRSILDAWQPLDDPLKHVIRRAFRRNRSDTSPRLIFPALDAAYRALATLRNAALVPSAFPSSSSTSTSTSTSTSSDPITNPNPNLKEDAAAPPTTRDEAYIRKEQARGSILRFLTARQVERRRSLTAKELHPPHSRNPPPLSSAPKPETLPLLVRVTSPPAASSSSHASPNAPSTSAATLSYGAWQRQQQQEQYQRRFQNPLFLDGGSGGGGGDGESQSQHQLHQHIEETPVYTTPHRPVPASQLGGSGRRRVPHLEMAGDFIFLRKSKPQSPVLSRVLTQKIRAREKRTSAVQSLIDFEIPEAELEDAWEESVENLLLQQQELEEGGGDGTGTGDLWTANWNDDAGDGGWGNGNVSGSSSGGGGGGGGSSAARKHERKSDRKRKMSEYHKAARRNDDDTYRHNLWWHGVVHLEAALSREREDQVARAAALRDLIIRERELAEQEKAERWEARRRYWEENIKPTMTSTTDGDGDNPRPRSRLRPEDSSSRTKGGASF